MKSVFDPEVHQELLDRINKITPQTKPLWGKMNASQMLKHSQVSFKMALGEMTLKKTVVGVLFGRLAKYVILSPKPFRKNSPTAKEFLVKDQPDFQKEKEMLVNLIERVYQKGKNGLTPVVHPFFGTMTLDEWDCLIYKHLDHHLTQFGV